jgi:hypothetical protein
MLLGLSVCSGGSRHLLLPFRMAAAMDEGSGISSLASFPIFMFACFCLTCKLFVSTLYSAVPDFINLKLGV